MKKHPCFYRDRRKLFNSNYNGRFFTMGGSLPHIWTVHNISQEVRGTVDILEYEPTVVTESVQPYTTDPPLETLRAGRFRRHSQNRQPIPTTSRTFPVRNALSEPVVRGDQGKSRILSTHPRFKCEVA